MSTLSQRNKERLNQSLQGKMSDATPFYLFVSYPFVQSATGVCLKDYFTSPKLMFDTQMELYEKLEGCFSFYPDYALLPECHCLGGELIFDRGGMPGTKAVKINSIGDVKKLKIGDPYGGSLMTNALEALAYMKKHAPADADVTGPMLVGPVTASAMLRGITDFCTDLYTEPEIVEALLELVTDTQIKYLKAQEKILGKLDKILIADDISSFLSVEFFYKYVKPSYDKIFKEFPLAQKWLHNDAVATHLAPEIAAYGFDVWHVGFCIDMIAASKTMPNRKTVLLGNIIPIDELVKPKPETVKEICNKMMDRFEEDPRFVLSTGGFISYGTPIENVKAMMYAADARSRK